MLVVPIPEREFNLYALSLPEGPNFDPHVVVSGWKCDNARSVGGALSHLHLTDQNRSRKRSLAFGAIDSTALISCVCSHNPKVASSNLTPATNFE